MDILKLEEYTITDNGTQLNKYGGEYELYGISEDGMLFERDNDRVLYHVSSGVKLIDTWSPHGCFFRYGDDSFYAHYKNEKDYKYSDKPIKLSKDNIIKVIKEYVYLHSPNLHSWTCMGWNTKLGVLADPNYCSAKVLLDDFNEYSIGKRFDTVKMYKYNYENKFDYDKNEKEPFLSFELDEKLYEKALDFQWVKKKIYKRFGGCLDTNLLHEYIKLEKEIKQELGLELV